MKKLKVNILDTKLFSSVSKEITTYNLKDKVMLINDPTFRTRLYFDKNDLITKDYILRVIFEQLGISNPF